MKRTRDDTVSSNLPDGLKQRRERCGAATHNEFLDVEGIDSAIEELKRRSEEVETEITAAQRGEAKYLLNYAREYRKLTQLSSLASLSGRPPTVAQGSVDVLGRSFSYYSRQGNGRRYTTIERRQRPQYGSERDGGKQRSYGQQGCPKALRARFVGRFCRDVDIKNCHPVIALQLMSKLTLPRDQASVDLPNVTDYVQHRDTPGGWIETLAEFHQIPEDVEGQRKELIKNLFTRLLNGGEYAAWSWGKLKRVLKDSEQEPRVKQMRVELLKLRQMVFASEQWKGFAAAEFKTQAGKGKSEEASKRATFSIILQTIENDILQVMIDAFSELGWEVTTLIFDGMHVLDSPNLSLASALRHAERRVRAVTGYDVELTEKPLFGKHEQPIELTRI